MTAETPHTAPRTGSEYESPLSVTSTPYGEEIVVIRLAGELDRANVADAARGLEEAIAREGTMVVLDLQDLDFIDASGIALLADLDRRERLGARLRTLPSRSLGVTRVLSTVGLDSMVKVVRGPY
jgi:anti-sigma B factor antagonist